MPTPPNSDLRRAIDASEERLFDKFLALGATERQLEELHEADLAEKYGNWLADGDAEAEEIRRSTAQ